MKTQKTKIAGFLTVLFTMVSTVVLAGGGWPQPKGKGYYKLSEWWILSDQHYTDAGLIDPNLTTGIYTSSLYAEYGFSDRWTGIIYFPFFSRSLNYNQVSSTTGEILIPGEAIHAPGDLDLTLKYGLSRPGQGLAISASITLGIPFGEDAGGNQMNLQTGDGEFNQYLRIDAGTSLPLFSSVSSYANVYTGINNRTNDFSDEFRYGLELGFGFLNDRVWINGKLDGVASFQNGATAAQVNSTSLFANNAEYTSLTVEANIYFNEKMGLSFATGNALNGKIILASPSYSVGFFLDIK